MMLPQSMQDGESALTEKATRWPTPREAMTLPLPLPPTAMGAAVASDAAAIDRAAVRVDRGRRPVTARSP